MGSPKALALWKGRPLLEHQLEAVEGFGQRIVVLGAAADRILSSLSLPDDVKVIENHDWATGRSGSLRCGFHAVSQAALAVLVAAVDQPVAPEAVEAILDQLDPAVHAYAVPRVGDQRGHPVVWVGTMLPTLRELGDSETLRDLVIRYQHAGLEVPIESALALRNFNRPEDLAAD